MTRLAPKSAYDILGVSPQDDFATIRRAWVALVKANHPDALGCASEDAARRLARINDAYDALRWHNPEKVRIYREQEAQTRKGRAATGARREGPKEARGSDDSTPRGGQSHETHTTAPLDYTDSRTAAIPVFMDSRLRQALVLASQNYRAVAAICNGKARQAPHRLTSCA